MRNVAEHHYGNPSSIHSAGQKAQTVIEKARGQMAKAIGCSSREIIFTGGGTEANNLVLWSVLHQEKKHVVTSAIEHPAVLNVLDKLKEFGVSHTALAVDNNGLVRVGSVREALTEKTGLISIMLANNEIGTLQPVTEIAALAKEQNIPMHTDAVQTLGKIPINTTSLAVDCMSFSAHKFYGPKGVGALFVRNGVKLYPLIIGGSQEKSLRAGTENTVGIAGLGLAAQLAAENVLQTRSHLNKLAHAFREQISNEFPKVVFNTQTENVLPGLISLTFPNFRSDLLMIHLDRANIAVSSGSACSSGDIQPSTVLQAIGLADDLNICTLRISFGTGNTREDVDYLVNALHKAITQIRAVS